MFNTNLVEVIKEAASSADLKKIINANRSNTRNKPWYDAACTENKVKFKNILKEYFKCHSTEKLSATERKKYRKASRK